MVTAFVATDLMNAIEPSVALYMGFPTAVEPPMIADIPVLFSSVDDPREVAVPL